MKAAEAKAAEEAAAAEDAKRALEARAELSRRELSGDPGLRDLQLARDWGERDRAPIGARASCTARAARGVAPGGRLGLGSGLGSGLGLGLG